MNTRCQGYITDQPFSQPFFEGTSVFEDNISEIDYLCPKDDIF